MPLTRQQLQSAAGLLDPLGRLLELTQQALVAHHPEGSEAGDCPVCAVFMEEMGEALEQWADARARAEEHWDV